MTKVILSKRKAPIYCHFESAEIIIFRLIYKKTIEPFYWIPVKKIA